MWVQRVSGPVTVPVEVEVAVGEMGLWGNDRLEEEQRLPEVAQKNETMSHLLCRMRPGFSARQHPYSVYCRAASQIVAAAAAAAVVVVEEEQQQQQQQQQGGR